MGHLVDGVNTIGAQVASKRYRVRKDGTVAWQVLYRFGGKQESRTFDHEKGVDQAIELIDELGVEAALEIIDARRDPDDPTPRLDDWCEQYITNLTGVTAGTRSRYRRMVELNLGRMRRMPLDAINTDVISAWVNAMSAEGLSGKTIANRHGFISGALKAAMRAKHIASNPCDGTRLPKTEREEMVFLTGSEFARLLDYVREDAQDLVTVLVSTGLRWGEASALQPRDIDTEHGTITVTRSWKWTDSNEMVLGPPKSKKSRRTIAVPEQALELLIARIARMAPTDWVFTNPKGEPWKEPAFHSAVWQPAVYHANGQRPPRHRPEPATPRLRKDGQPWGARKSLRPIAPEGEELGKKPRIHDLRHSCAAWMIRDGVSLPVIQRHLGHESITTTIDTYGHLEPSQLALAADSLSRSLVYAYPALEAIEAMEVEAEAECSHTRARIDRTPFCGECGTRL